MIANEHPGAVREAYGNLVGRHKGLNATQTESAMIDPVAFVKASRQGVFLVRLFGGFLHYLFP